MAARKGTEQKVRKPRAKKAKAEAPATENSVPVQAASPTAHLAPYQWQPGQSGNPAGKPKGARNKLGEAFLVDLFDDWKEHGKVAIAETRASKPAEYLKVVASLLPKQVHVKEDALEDFDDDELGAALAAIMALRKAGGAGKETLQ